MVLLRLRNWAYELSLKAGRGRGQKDKDMYGEREGRGSIRAQPEGIRPDLQKIQLDFNGSLEGNRGKLPV